jgi:transcriptional regulator with XRE-family HTH domain
MGDRQPMDETIDEIYVRNLFAKNLKRLRLNRKMSQLDLADATKLSHNFINDIENSKKFVSDETIVKFVKVLKVEPFRFFLPEEKLNARREDIIFEDFSESVGMIVKEHCNSYFKGDPSHDPDKIR